MPDRAVVETRAITSAPVHFRGIRDWLAGVARAKGFDEHEALELMVAVNEACANIHRHAYCGREDGAIEFQLEVRESILSLRIRDYGSRFRLEAYQQPDLEHPTEGGYGVFLIRELMDEVEYVQMKAGTELRMLKVHRGGPTGKGGQAHVGES